MKVVTSSIVGAAIFFALTGSGFADRSHDKFVDEILKKNPINYSQAHTKAGKSTDAAKLAKAERYAKFLEKYGRTEEKRGPVFD